METLSEIEPEPDRGGPAARRQKAADGRAPRARTRHHLHARHHRGRTGQSRRLTSKAGDPVLVTEAMKMETEVQAPIAGTVAAVHVAKGDSVNPDEALIEINEH